MNRRRRVRVSVALGVGFLVVMSGCVLADDAEVTELSAYRVLIVDGTKTLNATMRVLALANVIRQSGLAQVTVQLADDLGSFDEPLIGREGPDRPYHLIILVPRGVDDATCYGVWVVLSSASQGLPDVAAAVELLAQAVDAVFAGITRAVSAGDDLWAAATAALYVQEGWLE